MSKKANPAVIGIFLVGAVVLSVMALFLFGSGKVFSKTESFVLYFSTSVNGLDVGAPVKFKGVKIGQVTRIFIRFNQPDTSAHIPVLIEIDTRKLKNDLGVVVDLGDAVQFEHQIKNGLRGRLDFQSFVTGKLYVELDYFADKKPPVLVQQKYIYKEIPTVTSNLKEFWEAATNTLSKISQVDFEGISKHVESFVKKLDNGISDIQFKEINDSIIGAWDSIQDMVGSDQFQQAMVDFEASMASARKVTLSLEENVGPLTADVKETLNKIQGAVGTFYDFSEPNSSLRYELDTAINDIAGAARAVRLFANYLEQNPNALLTGKAPQVPPSSTSN